MLHFAPDAKVHGGEEGHSSLLGFFALFCLVAEASGHKCGEDSLQRSRHISIPDKILPDLFVSFCYKKQVDTSFA
jgi:hypothetical protein